MAKTEEKFYLQGNKYTAERLATLTEVDPKTVKKTILKAGRQENEPIDDLFEISGRRDYIFQIYRFQDGLTYLSKIALKSDLYAFDLWNALVRADKQPLDEVDEVVRKLQEQKSEGTRLNGTGMRNSARREEPAPIVVETREPLTITLPPKWIAWLNKQELSKGVVIERVLEQHVEL